MAGPTVFDEIFARLTPDRILKDPRATGEGVPWPSSTPGSSGRCWRRSSDKRRRDIHPIEGAVFRPDSAAALPYDGRQSSPHGTTVADIILTLAPRVKLYSADVFGPQGRARSRRSSPPCTTPSTCGR